MADLTTLLSKFLTDLYAGYASANGSGLNMRLQDGTAAAPSLNFVSDTDNGLYTAAVNSFGFAAGGTNPMLVASGEIRITGNAILGWNASTDNAYGTASDIRLARIDASTLAFQNAAAAKIAVSLTGMTASVVLTLASSQTTTQTLTIPVTRQAETLAIKPQTTTTLSTPLNPVGTTNTSGLMMGLARTITPQVTGNVFVAINGNIANGTGGDGAKVEMRMGTGGAPVNAGALAGTVYGGQQIYTVVVGATDSVPFSLAVIVTGLTVGTAYWIDVDLAAITGGTATITNVSVSAFEL